MVNLDILWTKRGGRKEASRGLAAYAADCIKKRSTGTAGGQQVKTLEIADVVNNALLAAFEEIPDPVDGEQFYFLVRRKIDNRLHTIEKSPKILRTVSLVVGEASANTASIDVIADEQAVDPAANLVANEEHQRNERIVEETKRRLKSPQCMEARVLDYIVAGSGDKQWICDQLKIDGSKFDRLKFSLKNVVAAAKADVEKKTKR